MSTFDGKRPLRSIHGGDGELDTGLAFERLMDNAACASQERLLLDSEVVREAIKLNIFDPLLNEIKALRVLASNALLMARHGDYSRCGDAEGVMLDVRAMGNLNAEAAALGLEIGPTFYDNEQRYRPTN